VLAAPVVAVAQSRPCWDKVPPSEKYGNHHVVSANNGPYMPGDNEETFTMFADGLNVSVKLVDQDSFLRVEVFVTNCSASSVKINAKGLDLFKPDADRDIKLASLEPTHYKYPTGQTYPPLVPQTVAYGENGLYYLFFERDGRAQAIDMMNSNYTLGLTVRISGWQFNFAFPRK